MREELTISTERKIQLKDITHRVQEKIRDAQVDEGVCIVYCPHTTAGLVINENADPDVASDLERAFNEAVPSVRFDHAEGNSPAHFLSCITGASLHLLIRDSHLQLGRWQGVYFCEFDGPRTRRVWIKIVKDR